MIKIDKDIPLPSPKRMYYPFREMEVGDSFFVSGKSRGRISGSACWAAKSLGRIFKTRSVTENGIAGIRVWRAA